MGRVRLDGAGGGRGRVRLDLARRSLPLPRGRLGRRPVGGVDVPRRPRRHHGAGEAGPAGRVPQLPQPGSAREEGGRGRRDQRRALRLRSRRRLEPHGVRRVRDPLRPSRITLRGVLRDRATPPRGRTVHVRRPFPSGARRRAAPPSRATAAPDGRLDGRARPGSDASTRGHVEHLVRLVRQHTGGVRDEAAGDRCCVRARRSRSRVDRAQRLRPRAARRHEGATRRGRSARPSKDRRKRSVAVSARWRRPAPTS